MRKMNRSNFIDCYLDTIKDGDSFKRTPILTNWYNSHILIDSRLNMEYDRIKTYLDGLKVTYKELVGHDECFSDLKGTHTIEREYYGIYIFNSNFRNADMLEAD